MRLLIILRGMHCSGKSTFIRKHELEDCTVDFESIKRMAGGVRYGYENRRIIIQDERHSETGAYGLLKTFVKNRMEQGETCIVDARHLTFDEVAQYEDLAETYRYRMAVLCMEADFGILQSRNARLVPRERLSLWRMEDDYITYCKYTAAIREHFDIIREEEFFKMLRYEIEDYDNYEDIRIIGDVHSSAGALEAMIDDAPETARFCFLGDYLDRGSLPIETLELLTSIADRSVFLYGNHEEWFEAITDMLEQYRDGMTLEELLSLRRLSFDAKKTVEIIYGSPERIPQVAAMMRAICKRLEYYLYFTYGGRRYFLNHGGVTREIIEAERPGLFPRSVFMKGIGLYSTPIDAIYGEHHPRVIQLHGHRNKFGVEAEDYEYMVNLEGAVESGGALRVYCLNHNGSSMRYYRENRDSEERKHGIRNEAMRTYYTQAKHCKDVMVRPRRMRHVFSVTLREGAHQNPMWESFLSKADGMFLNRSTETVVARGYDKMWQDYETVDGGNRWGIRDTDRISRKLAQRFRFPVEVFHKNNGYTAFLGYNEEQDVLFYASKLGDDSIEAERFEEIFTTRYPEHLEDIKAFLRTENVCMTFEVLEPDNISNYTVIETPEIILTGVLNRTLEQSYLDYDALCATAECFGLDVVKRERVLENVSLLRDFIEDVHQRKALNGVWLRDADGRSVKVKTAQQLMLQRLYIVLRRAQAFFFEENFVNRQTGIEADFLEYIRWNLTETQRYCPFREVIEEARPFFEHRGFRFEDGKLCDGSVGPCHEV